MLQASVFSTAAFHRTVPEDRPTIDERADGVHRGDPRGRRWVAREAGHRHERSAAHGEPVCDSGAGGSGTLFVAWHCLFFGASAFRRARCAASRVGLGAAVFRCGGRRPCGLRAVATLLNEVRVMRGDRGFVLFLMVVLVALTALFYELFPRHGEQGQMGESASAPAGAPSPAATGK
jgi:hypothetical protein